MPYKSERKAYELRVCDEFGMDELIQTWANETPQNRVFERAAKYCDKIGFEGYQLVLSTPRSNGAEFVYEGKGNWSDVSNSATKEAKDVYATVASEDSSTENPEVVSH